MNKKLCNEFINQIENLSGTGNNENFFKDRFGINHTKTQVLESFVFHARELTKYGEHIIALENMLSNLDEVSITIDKETIDLARQAFGERITEEIELLLESLRDKGG